MSNEDFYDRDTKQENVVCNKCRSRIFIKMRKKIVRKH